MYAICYYINILHALDFICEFVPVIYDLTWLVDASYLHLYFLDIHLNAI